MSNINDKRLVYNYNSKKISFVENFDNAVSRANGYYAIIIGDDDGIDMRIIDLCRWAKEKEIDAIKLALNASYVWPGTFTDKTKVGELIIRGIKVKIKSINPKNSVVKMFRAGSFRYQDYKMPQIYHGIIRMEAFNKVKNTTGKYFGGLTPDIYSSVALSFVVKKMVLVNYSFTLPGVCYQSGSADSKLGKHTGELEDSPHFSGHTNYVWDSNIPNFYSVDTIWGDSAIKAVVDMEKSNLINELNMFKMTISLVYYYKNFKNRILHHYCVSKNIKSNLFIDAYFYTLSKAFGLNKFLKRSIYYIIRKILGRKVILNVGSASEAISIIHHYNDRIGYTRKYSKSKVIYEKKC